MTMTSSVRKVALTAHITSTLGWLGAIIGFLAVAIAGLRSNDVQLVRSTYLAMELIGWYVLVPLCVASLLTGLIMSWGTTWGLFRHYWVVIKFVITVVSSVILFMYTQTLEQIGELARNPSLTIEALRNGSPVLHASAAIVALLVNTVLSIYKPRGLTAYGRVKHAKPRGVETDKPAVAKFADRPRPKSVSTSSSGRPRWVYVVGIHAIGLALLFLAVHLAGGMPGH
jgi:uncharacterized membrane protein